MGVPWGEMKGVEHSEADPKVAALDMSELELELKFASFWAPPPAGTPPGWLRRCRGSADPELCLDLIIGGTGVDLEIRSQRSGTKFHYFNAGLGFSDDLLCRLFRW